MSHRRVDVIYLSIVLVALGAAYVASLVSRDEEDGGLVDIGSPDLKSELELPPAELPEPFFLFRSVSRTPRERVSRPGVSDPLETALVEVRSALLDDSLRGDDPFRDVSRK